MTTVLTVGNSEGSRSCNATCHDARKPSCDCVCGGRYHGKGSDHVLDHVRADVEKGVSGEVVRVETARQKALLERTAPARVRFHAREVAKALRRRENIRWRQRRTALGEWFAAEKRSCPGCAAPLFLSGLVYEQLCYECGRALSVDVRNGHVTVGVA